LRTFSFNYRKEYHGLITCYLYKSYKNSLRDYSLDYKNSVCAFVFLFCKKILISTWSKTFNPIRIHFQAILYSYRDFIPSINKKSDFIMKGLESYEREQNRSRKVSSDTHRQRIKIHAAMEGGKTRTPYFLAIICASLVSPTIYHACVS